MRPRSFAILFEWCCFSVLNVSRAVQNYKLAVSLFSPEYTSGVGMNLERDECKHPRTRYVL